MVAQLKGLLGKTNRPIVVNGKLLCMGRNLVAAHLSNYKLAFDVLGLNQDLSASFGELMINQEIRRFRDAYDEILNGTGLDADALDMSVDQFTGAVIIETPAYRELIKREMHETGRQYNHTMTALIRQFMVEYTVNWFDNYVYLFNRRIAAQHMPIMVRGHFVAGLYQPLIVGTKSLPSPLLYGANQWFYNLLSGGEEYLERSSDSTRKLDLSCVAMCDVADTFHTPVIYELDRKVWMLMVELVVLSKLSEEATSEVTKKYNFLFRKALYNPLESSRSEGRMLTEEQRDAAIHRNNAQLFSSMVDFVSKMDTQLRTV